MPRVLVTYRENWQLQGEEPGLNLSIFLLGTGGAMRGMLTSELWGYSSFNLKPHLAYHRLECHMPLFLLLSLPALPPSVAV